MLHKNSFKKFRKIFSILLAFFLLLVIGGVIFIKFNTTAAAEFTDNVLRPALGANNVIFLEKIFFNASDKMQQLTVKEGDIQAHPYCNSVAEPSQPLTHAPTNPGKLSSQVYPSTYGPPCL